MTVGSKLERQTDQLTEFTAYKLAFLRVIVMLDNKMKPILKSTLF